MRGFISLQIHVYVLFLQLTLCESTRNPELLLKNSITDFTGLQVSIVTKIHHSTFQYQSVDQIQERTSIVSIDDNFSVSVAHLWKSNPV